MKLNPAHSSWVEAHLRVLLEDAAAAGVPCAEVFGSLCLMAGVIAGKSRVSDTPMFDGAMKIVEGWHLGRERA